MIKKSTKVKKALKILAKLLIALVLLLILLLLSLRIPFVQNKIVDFVTIKLSEQLQTTVSVERVYLNFLDNANVKGIYIEDQVGDTLLYSDELDVDIAIFKLLKNRIEIENIYVDHAVVNVMQGQDSVFNFQFIIDAFASSDTVQTSSETSFTIDIDRVELLNSNINANLISNDIQCSFEKVVAVITNFDLENQVYELRRLQLRGLDVQVIHEPTLVVNDSIQREDVSIGQIEEAFLLESIPISLICKKFTIEESDFLVKDRGARRGHTFDPAFIDLTKLNLAVLDIDLNSSSFAAKIDEFAVQITNDIQLKELQGEIYFDDSEWKLSDFVMKSLGSSLEGQIAISYPSFDALTRLDKSTSFDLNVKPSSIFLQEIQYFSPELFQDPQLAVLQNKKLKIQGKVKGKVNQFDISSLLIEWNKTKLIVDGRVKDVLDTENLILERFAIEGYADYEDYKLFISSDTLERQMSQIGDLRLSAEVSGGLKSMNFAALNVSTEAILEAHFTGEIKNIDDLENLSYDLNIERIISGREDAAIFLDSLPSIVQKFDRLEYSGKVLGTKYKADLTGGFATSLGDLMTNLKVEFNESYTDASYVGLLGTEAFELGELLDNDSLGIITMQARIDGRGLSADSIKSSIEAVVEEVVFNKYSYKKLNIDGRIDGLEFIGNASIDDENVRFRFDGMVDLNDSIPVMQFDFELDTLNLGKLNLAGEIFQATFKMNADLRGITLDDADGDIVIRDLSLRKVDRLWSTDSIEFVAARRDGERGLFLDADFIDADITGDFQLALLPDVLLDFMDQYFPMKTFLGSSPKEDPILDQQEVKRVRNDVINAKISVFNILELARFMDIPLTKMDSAELTFNLNAPTNLSGLELYIPAVEYSGYFVDSIYLTASNDDYEFSSTLTIDSISISESMHINGLIANAIFKEQRANIRLTVLDGEDDFSLSIGSDITTQEDGVFKVAISDTFVLNEKFWTVVQDSSIEVSSSGVIVPTLEIKNKGEGFLVGGDNKTLDFQFRQFDINNIINIVNVDSLDISGLMDGELQVGLVEDVPLIGDLVINNIVFNDFDIGDLTLDMQKNGEDVNAAFKVEGEEVKIRSQVDYQLTDGKLRGNVNVNKINLVPFNPFVAEYAKNLQGVLNGRLEVGGTVDNPLMKGKINIKDGQAFIVDLSTTYYIKEGSMTLSDGLIEPYIQLVDDQERTSELTGNINHEYFQDLRFDLRFTGDRFTFLDSKASKKELFYGKFIGSVDAVITGSPEFPKIKASVEALEGTDMTVQLLNSDAVLSQENYVVFFDGSKVKSIDEIDSIAEVAYDLGNLMDVDLRLKATPDALFHVIVDPITGDRLDIKGTADLQVDLPSKGDLSILGDFIVSEGKYRVSYENTIKRTFLIDPGSEINFQGDPYTARLDMRAIYETKANTFTLIDNLGSNVGDDGSASSRTDVEVVLNVAGTLEKPVLSFDIRIPSTSNSPVESSISTALNTLRQNETQLLEQVFSLILFNSFTGGSSGGNISSVGTSQAISSVGNLINNQLNKLASKAKGFEVDFQVDQYKDVSTEQNANVTEFGLGVRQSLLDDRLVISAGGNANLETGQSANNNFSSFAGDFVITYLLTEDGKYRVKVFQKTDYNALSNDNIWKTGVGLSYKAKFGRVAPKQKVKADN